MLNSFNEMDFAERYDFLWNFIEKRIPIFLLGPAGSGKSYIGKKLMERFIREYYDFNENQARDYIINLHSIDESKLESYLLNSNMGIGLYVAGSANITKIDLLGGRTFRAGNYVRQKGILSIMRERGGIIFIDEISSLPPHFVILINEILDAVISRETHENFYIFFAGNPSVYTGTFDIPDSTLERCQVIWFDYYPRLEEIKIVSSILVEHFPNNKLFSTLLNQLNSRDLDDLSDNIKPFYTFILYISGLLRDLRESFQLPISPRTIANVIARIFIHSKGRQQKKTFDSLRDLSFQTKLGIAKYVNPELINEPLNKNAVSANVNEIIEMLDKFMRSYGVSWSIIFESLSSISLIYKDSSLRENVNSVLRSKIPGLE